MYLKSDSGDMFFHPCNDTAAVKFHYHSNVAHLVSTSRNCRNFRFKLPQYPLCSSCRHKSIALYRRMQCSREEFFTVN